MSPLTFSRFATFMILLAVLAYLNPSIGNTGGLLRTEITANYIATSLVFLVTGLTLPVQGLSTVLQRWDMLFLTQGFAFIIFPCITMLCVFFLQHYPIHPSILEGFQILSVLPPSVSSASMLTKLVGGNVVTSSMNSACGCILGILLTPVFISWLHDSHDVDVPNRRIFLHLFLTAVFPLVVGQLIHSRHWRILNGETQVTFGQFLVLFAFYARVCTALSRDHIYEELDRFSLIITIVMMIVLHIAMTLMILLSSHHLFHHPARDAVAIMFVASRKSVSLGLPIIVNIFEDIEEAGCLSLPLLVYSPIQILIGGLSVQPVKWWIENHQPVRRR